MGLLNIAYCPVGLGERLTGQPSRQQCATSADTEKRRWHAQSPVADGNLVKEGKRCRQVSRSPSGNPAVEHRVDRFLFLTSLGEQTSRGRKVSIRTVWRPYGEVNEPTPFQSTSRPDSVVGTLQHADRLAEVIKCLGIPAECPPANPPPVEHAPLQHAIGHLDGSVKGGIPACSPARVNQGQAQRPQHISFAIRRSDPAGQTQRGPQLTYPGIDIADVTQDDPGRLVCYQRLVLARMPR